MRGADFTDARLVNAKFTDAILGVRPLTGGLILAAALIVSVGAGTTVGYFAETIRQEIVTSDWRDTVAGWSLVAIVLVFFGSLIANGVRRAVWASLIALIVLAASDVIAVYSIAGEIRPLNSLRLIGLLLALGLATLAGVLGRIVGGAFGAWAIGLVAAAGGIAADRASGGVAALIVSGLLVYISTRALNLDERDRLLEELAHRIVHPPRNPRHRSRCFQRGLQWNFGRRARRVPCHAQRRLVGKRQGPDHKCSSGLELS